MRRLIGLVGLPGAGKTTWALNNVKSDEFYIDDIRDLNSIKIVEDDYEVVYFSDPHLCHDKTRQMAEEKLLDMFGISVEWLYWENDVDKCWQNVQRRGERVISKGFLEMLSDNYTPGSNLIEVYEREE